MCVYENCVGGERRPNKTQILIIVIFENHWHYKFNELIDLNRKSKKNHLLAYFFFTIYTNVNHISFCRILFIVFFLHETAMTKAKKLHLQFRRYKKKKTNALIIWIIRDGRLFIRLSSKPLSNKMAINV